MNKFVCGFDENGKFLSGCVYKDEDSLIRPKMLNRAVVLTEVVEQEIFDLYRQGYYRNVEGVPTKPKAPELTQEELAEQALAQAKAERAEAVAKIVVEVDGMLFDGDETSQTRMARSAVAMTSKDTITWVLHDNTIAQVTKAQLLQALRLSGEEQTRLWTMPYEA